MKNINIKITTEYIKLDQLLKFAGMVDSGAHSKYVIKTEKIFINGSEVNMRGKKIRPGDVVIFRETQINVC